MKRYIEVKEGRSLTASVVLVLLVTLTIAALVKQPTTVGELAREGFSLLANAADGLVAFLLQLGGDA